MLFLIKSDIIEHLFFYFCFFYRSLQLLFKPNQTQKKKKFQIPENSNQTKPKKKKKKISNPRKHSAILPARSRLREIALDRDRDRRRDLAFATSRRIEIAIDGAISRSVDRDLAKHHADRDRTKRWSQSREAPCRSRSRDASIAILIAKHRVDRDLAFADASRDRDLAGAISRRRDCDQRRDLATTQSCVREIAIDASQDRAVDRDLDPARSREGEIAIDGAISRSVNRRRRTGLILSRTGARTGDQRGLVFSSRARALSLSLSLFFRKSFEVKIEV